MRLYSKRSPQAYLNRITPGICYFGSLVYAQFRKCIHFFVIQLCWNGSSQACAFDFICRSCFLHRIFFLVAYTHLPSVHPSRAVPCLFAVIIASKLNLYIPFRTHKLVFPCRKWWRWLWDLSNCSKAQRFMHIWFQFENENMLEIPWCLRINLEWFNLIWHHKHIPFRSRI